MRLPEIHICCVAWEYELVQHMSQNGNLEEGSISILIRLKISRLWFCSAWVSTIPVKPGYFGDQFLTPKLPKHPFRTWTAPSCCFCTDLDWIPWILRDLCSPSLSVQWPWMEPQSLQLADVQPLPGRGSEPGHSPCPHCSGTCGKVPNANAFFLFLQNILFFLLLHNQKLCCRRTEIFF